MTQLTTTKAILRPLEIYDAPDIVKYINSKTIAKNTTLNVPWTIEDARWWLGFIKYAAKKELITEHHFGIEVEGQLCGTIAIINIFEHRGELGYWLADEYSGQGIMTDVIANMTKYCFDSLNMVRIFAPVLPHNKASCRVLEKNDYQLEGTLRKYYNKKGKYFDALAYARVK